MSDRIEITQAELLDAIRESARKPTAPPGAMTAAELREALGIRQTALKRRLRALAAAGRLEVWTTERIDLAGRPQQIPAYTIKPNKPAPAPTPAKPRQRAGAR